MKRSWLGAVVALAGIAAAPIGAQQVDLSSGSVAEIVSKLRPGGYVWAPEVAPSGPLLLIVNLPRQRATLFRNGLPIGASTVSTGRPGHETPTGVFTILQKQVEHYSSKYDSAPMPYMERLTWQGVALHAGHLPGYPASHGCIRLPAGFARLLYGVTAMGMTVVITDRASTPRVAPAPQIVSNDQSSPYPQSAELDWHPDRSPAGPVSIVVSAADHRAIVLRNGIIIGTGPVTVTGPVGGTWAYALRNIDGQGQHWIRLQLSSAAKEAQQVPRAEWGRFQASDAFRHAVAAIIEPGTTVVVTADSLRPGDNEPRMIIEGPGH